MQQLISVGEFSPLIQEYASYKASIQGCSQKTVDEYLLDLRTFFRFLIARDLDMTLENGCLTWKSLDDGTAYLRHSL